MITPLACTVTALVPAMGIVPQSAVTDVEPPEFPITRPVLLMDATAEFNELHVTELVTSIELPSL